MRIRSVIPTMPYSQYKDQPRLSTNSVKWKERVDTQRMVSAMITRRTHRHSLLIINLLCQLHHSQPPERKSSVVVILESNLNGRTKCYKTSSFPLTTNGSTTSSTTISNEAEQHCQMQQEKSFLTGDPHSN